jgi:hypothetical protein
MRFVVAAGLAAVIFTAVTTAQTPAPAPLAGERYKSVRVLTDIPASSVIPTMAFISNSLGVTCAHCHTDVYESDDKPMKDKARQMIRMMRAINDTQFNGKRVVTCQTCHHGRAVPVSTPEVESAGWNKGADVAEAPLPAIDSILQRYEASVGVNALKSLKSQTATGTITRNNGRTAPSSDSFELIQELPRTMKLSTPLSHPPEAEAELPVTFLRPPLLRDAYKDLHVIGRERIPESVVVIEGVSARGLVHRLYFSEQTGLLIRRTDEIDTPLGPLPERYDFSDYREADGVRVPMRIVWSRADYQVTFAIARVTHVPLH